ncbi:MAG TPA: hypothetical protein DEV81_07155 [Cyanobacteria bacterium UBA11049]|nr:hypothetical protein [Cyanobacteria bacterium UBA11049]
MPHLQMTLERESALVKREAHKTYELASDRERPDLAIEIVVTSGGINKLEAYKRLQIPEVWFWQNGRLSVHHLRTTETESVYEEINRSELLPELDLELLKRCIDLPNHTQALKEFRQSLSYH